MHRKLFGGAQERSLRAECFVAMQARSRTLSQRSGQRRPGRPQSRPRLPWMNEDDADNSWPVGLYDPRFEHDSCGVSFVANIKGVPSHDLVRDRPRGADQPRAPGCDRRRSGHRAMVPGSSSRSRPLPPGRHRRRAASAGRLRRRVGVPAAPTTSPPRRRRRRSRPSSPRRASTSSAWRPVPVNPTASAPPPARRCRRSSTC